jgi:hypothetical protein
MALLYKHRFYRGGIANIVQLLSSPDVDDVILKQSLPDWPWQFVDATKLSDSLSACSKGTQDTTKKKQGTQSQSS